MSRDWQDRNRELFNATDTVGSYGPVVGLQACEEAVFADHVGPHDAVLDLGVGTGRTTPALTSRAASYVGVDYAPAMVAEARRLHPGCLIVEADATDLGQWDDASFDVIVFSYNGIDYLYPDKARRSCLAECRRLLREDGRFIHSQHDPLGLVVLPKGAAGLGWLARVVLMSVRRAGRHLRTRAFWKGSGYVLEPVRGGLLTHMATPRRVRQEAIEAGFEVIDEVAYLGRGRTMRLCSGWRYYVFKRSDCDIAP